MLYQFKLYQKYIRVEYGYSNDATDCRTIKGESCGVDDEQRGLRRLRGMRWKISEDNWAVWQRRFWWVRNCAGAAAKGSRLKSVFCQSTFIYLPTVNDASAPIRNTRINFAIALWVVGTIFGISRLNENTKSILMFLY